MEQIQRQFQELMNNMTTLTQQNHRLEEQNRALQRQIEEGQAETRSTGSSSGINIIETLKYVLLNLKQTGGDYVSRALLRAMIRSCPHLFVQTGSIHTDRLGSRTYYSVRIYDDETFSSYSTTIHVNVSQRFDKPKILSIQLKSHETCSIINFERQPMFAPEE